MTRSSAAPGRVRGGIDELPSGALRVRVYAGVDPVSKRRHYLTEIIAAGPGADRQTRRIRGRLVSQVEERRNPRTKAGAYKRAVRWKWVTANPRFGRHHATADRPPEKTCNRQTRSALLACYLGALVNNASP